MIMEYLIMSSNTDARIILRRGNVWSIFDVCGSVERVQILLPSMSYNPVKILASYVVDNDSGI